MCYEMRKKQSYLCDCFFLISAYTKLMSFKRKVVGHFFIIIFASSLFLETAALDTLTPPKTRFECLTLAKNLKRGMAVNTVSKTEVQLLQSFLAVHGYFKVQPNGLFGQATEAALNSYQKTSGLPATGIVDERTRLLIAQKNCVNKTTPPQAKEVSTSSINLPASSAKDGTTTSAFSWVFHNKKYEMNVPLSASLYSYYRQSPKVFTYKGALPTNWTETYNTTFLKVRSGDYTFDSVTTALLTLARKDNLSQDDTANFILSFAQSIPYDFNKDLKKDLTQYPYETLYTNKGVCADKTFLAYELLKRAGYGVAIMQFLEINHQAVGIRCSPEDAVFNSGYCYAETTNFLPIGMVPTSFGENGKSVGMAPGASDNLPFLFDTQRLGKADILVKTEGKTYTGFSTLKEKVTRLGTLTKDMEKAKTDMASSTEDLDKRKAIFYEIKKSVDAAAEAHDYAAYTDASALYKKKFDEYGLAYSVYQEMVTEYNKDVKEYNSLRTLFDQTK